MARDELQHKAQCHGEPTMRLRFEEGKLMQLFILQQNHGGIPGVPMHVWVEIEGQGHGENSSAVS